MTKINDLTQGSISKGIWSMAIPLITASFVQMAYNMTDMIWLGHLGSESVAAVGVAGFFTWVGNALSFISKVGAEVTISQSLGARAGRRARAYANQSAMLSTIIALGYACFIYIAAPMLVGLFHLEENISELAIMYMRLVTPGLFFTFNNNTYSGLYNGQGNSKTPLKIVATGLIFNIVLDPLLIYGYGFVPAMGTAGAAIATTFSQLVVFSIFIWNLYFRNSSIGKLYFITRLRARFVKRIVSLGLPVSMQSALFAMFSLTLATVAAQWGHIGVAVQSVGAQIEAITWMTAAGFSTALAAFTGQNFGARNLGRIRLGYHYTLKLAGGIALIACLAFLFFSKEIFSVFINEPQTLVAGSAYLKILAISQIFSAIEQVTAGAFNGCGRTTPPAIVGIILTGARIPLAYYLVTFPSLGLNGIWWSISLSSVMKGIVLAIWYQSFQKRLENGQYKPVGILGKMHAVASRLWQQFN